MLRAVYILLVTVLTDFLAISMSGPLALPGLSDLVGSLTCMQIQHFTEN